jgi:hypothetical protein
MQNYTRIITKDGRELIRRREKEPEGDGLPHGHIRIASPYDTDARWGAKWEEFWLGYKLHVTETCDDAPPCTCALARRRAGTTARARRRPGRLRVPAIERKPNWLVSVSARREPGIGRPGRPRG